MLSWFSKKLGSGRLGNGDWTIRSGDSLGVFIESSLLRWLKNPGVLPEL
jgi:hypothetical protein